MSQNTDLFTVNDNTSADVFDNSNDHCKSTSDVTVVSNNNNNGWANFDTFENDTNHNSEVKNGWAMSCKELIVVYFSALL